MEIVVHRSANRGRTELGWLHSRHSFSFGEFYDPTRMQFGALRVLNDDIVEPGEGFGMHRHDHMEIVSIVLKGALLHADDAGHEAIIGEDEVQHMSAGTGVKHSEMNASVTDSVHFLQIWIKPKSKLVSPSYEQMKFDIGKNMLTPIATPHDDDGALTLAQDAFMYLADLDEGTNITHTFTGYKRGVYMFVIKGQLQIEDQVLYERDAAGITDTPQLKIIAERKSKILLIDVPMD